MQEATNPLEQQAQRAMKDSLRDREDAMLYGMTTSSAKPASMAMSTPRSYGKTALQAMAMELQLSRPKPFFLEVAPPDKVWDRVTTYPQLTKEMLNAQVHTLHWDLAELEAGKCGYTAETYTMAIACLYEDRGLRGEEGFTMETYNICYLIDENFHAKPGRKIGNKDIHPNPNGELPTLIITTGATAEQVNGFQCCGE